MLYPDGKTRYEGKMVNGLPHGYGRLWTAGGVVCAGAFEFGSAHGRAIQRMPNGNVYTGGFREGRRDGEGTFTFFQESVTVKGVWVNGIYQVQSVKT